MIRSIFRERERAMRTSRLAQLGAGVLTVALLAIGSTAAHAVTTAAAPPWVDGWAASPHSSAQATDTVSFADQTLRLIVHLHASGPLVRLRLSNTFGDRDLTINHASVGLRTSGAAVKSMHTVTFGGHGSVTIVQGTEASSDLVHLAVSAGQDLAVSLYLKDPTGPATYHRAALQTSYVSVAGDHATETGAASFTTTTGHWFLLDAVSVGGGTAPGTIVALGDSITDGSGSKGGANGRWPDLLSNRLQARLGMPAKSVVDEGIAGNRVLTDDPANGVSALHRLTRDVLVRRGLTDVILLEGINDLRSAAPAATAEQIIAGYQKIINRVHAKGARIFGATITPVEGSARYTATMEAQRQKINDWIRTPGHFDGFIDFAAAIQDPADPLHIKPGDDSGDHLHPNQSGYQAMADAIDLNLFN
jgi:lysophospholipase L1-like esterase